MLELRDITYTIEKDGEDLDLLHKISVKVRAGHFMALVGPSGCGKTTLMKIVAGLTTESEGDIFWNGKNLAVDGELHPSELGYVPQFSIAYDHLTVEECVENAIRLRVCTKDRDELYDLADAVIDQVGMDSNREKMVKVLSGGQKRRLGLAMELVSSPKLLLCDEVTSGLDPKSEREVVYLLHALSHKDERIVVNITHSLSNLELYDSVLVLHEGRVVYHGPPGTVAHYFSVGSVEDIYPQMAKRQADDWHDSWCKHRDAYYHILDRKLAGRKRTADSGAKSDDAALPPRENEPVPAGYGQPAAEIRVSTRQEGDDAADDEEEDEADHAGNMPSAVRQFAVLFARRWTLFFRDKTQLILHLAILFGFPFLVIIFALKGIGPWPVMPAAEIGNMEAVQDAAVHQTQIGGLISGLVMFQVILLTLMGSNNSAREIAGERTIYEKERLGGVRPSSYILSKVCFLGILVVAQSLWMAMFVELFTKPPGDFWTKAWLLVLVNGAMTFVCLGISASMKSPEQASLLSIYLVGFQLPLSGAVLKMPGVLETISQPFIAAYWSWSGQLVSMKGAAEHKGIYASLPRSADANRTPVAMVDTSDVASWMLWAHIAAGLLIAYLACRKRRWD